MIENWKQAHKMFSVQLAAIVAVIATLEPILPQLEGKIPQWAFAVASILVIVARLTKQQKLTDETVKELQRIKRIAKSAGLISIVMLALGCARSQAAPEFTPGELTCAAANEVKFDQELAKCDTDACIDDVTARHNAADDRCIEEN